MWSAGNFVDERFLCRSCLIIISAIILQAFGAASVVMPSSNCYALDNSSHIYDFTSWIGHPFEYVGKDVDLVVRFCKDVETRSQTGYVDFGRFDKLNYFVSGSEHINFVQGFYNGDLNSCELSYDKMGRTAQVNIICGSCPNGQCKDLLGCICNVTYESTCRVVVELAIPCEKQGLRVFEGFTVGFHPRSWEVVYDGMTQPGFEKSRHGFRNDLDGFILHGKTGDAYNICIKNLISINGRFLEMLLPDSDNLSTLFGSNVYLSPSSRDGTIVGSASLPDWVLYCTKVFGTEQTYVALYMTAIASLSGLVQKPILKIFPEKGLEVKLSGSGASGNPPTTLSPTVLIVDWICKQASDIPYEVDITVPIEGYEPIQFTLTKTCEYKQVKGGNATRGWAIFGVLSCIFIVLSTLLCCGGFVYNTKVQNQRGLNALPGMTILSACVETVSGAGHGYSRPEDLNSAFVNQASWERQPVSAQGSRRTTERTYGSM